MFEKSYESRLHIWSEFRKQLENSTTPVDDVVEFWSDSPWVSFQADPYDQKTWPNPWEMILENQYCDFVKILAICYTFQLTECFTGCEFQIHIMQSKANSDTTYILYMDGQPIIINGERHESQFESFENYELQKKHVMPPL